MITCSINTYLIFPSSQIPFQNTNFTSLFQSTKKVNRTENSIESSTTIECMMSILRTISSELITFPLTHLSLQTKPHKQPDKVQDLNEKLCFYLWLTDTCLPVLCMLLQFEYISALLSSSSSPNMIARVYSKKCCQERPFLCAVALCTKKIVNHHGQLPFVVRISNSMKSASQGLCLPDWVSPSIPSTLVVGKVLQARLAQHKLTSPAKTSQSLKIHCSYPFCFPRCANVEHLPHSM